MPIVDFTRATSSFSMDDPAFFNPDTSLTVSSNFASWQTASGNFVTFYGSNIALDDDGQFESGQITQIDIDLGSTDSEIVDIQVTGITGLDFAQSNTAGFVGGTQNIWDLILNGNTTLIAPNTPVGADSFGNGIDLDVGAVQGDFTTISGIWSAASFGGGFQTVSGNAIYIGGGLDFNGAALELYADVLWVEESAQVFGGDDTIVFTDATHEQLGLDPIAGFAPSISGDAGEVKGNGALIGGDDQIDAREVESLNKVIIFGDAGDISEDAVVLGGNDTIYGSATLRNEIYGDIRDHDGDVDAGDTMSVSGGNDTLYGGANNDIIFGDWRNRAEFESIGGNDTLYGGGGRDRLSGQKGDDLLYSGTGSFDELFGGDGDDRLFVQSRYSDAYGGIGNDRVIVSDDRFFALVGGEGIDLVSFYRVDADIVFDLTTNFISVDGFTDDDGGVIGFENVTGSNTGKDRITAGDDAQIIKTQGGNDKVFGGGGGDRIELGSGADFVRAGQTGANTYDGGSGVDTLSYSATQGAVRIDLRDDETSGGAAEGDVISGFLNVTGTASGDDTLIGNARGNDFVGLGGNDRLVGFDGNDRLEGRGGDDRLSGGNDDDDLFGGDGDDTIDAGRGRDDVFGGDGSDTFQFNKGDDVVIVRDFENNVDLFSLGGFDADLNWRDFATQRGDDVWIDFGGGDKLIIKDALIGWLGNDLDFV